MKNRSHGMTLIELLTAMLVLAILMGLAVPTFSDFAANSRTSAATSDLVTALNVARSEALRRSNLVVACASDDLADCSGATNWSGGWIVFSDANGDGNVDADELLQTWTGVQSGIETRATADRAVYNAMGMAQGAAGITFDIKKTGCSGPRAKRIVMSISGSLRTTKVAC
jgi:type IV fimbrial biogenesis protein FimT